MEIHSPNDERFISRGGELEFIMPSDLCERNDDDDDDGIDMRYAHSVAGESSLQCDMPLGCTLLYPTAIYAPLQHSDGKMEGPWL